MGPNQPTRSYRYFTGEEDDYIIANWPTMLLRDIAQALGRDRGSVQQRASVLGQLGRLDPKARYWHRPWTPEEEDWLRDNWGLHADAYCAEHLRRTVVACEIRSHRYAGVSRRTQFWTARNVAELFGVDSHLVANQWIASGCLRASRSHVGCGDGHLIWRIDDVEIERFIRRYPYHYDPKRLERGTYWRNLAEQVWAKDPWLTVDEAAEALGVYRNTVGRHLRRGWLKGERTWAAGGKNGAWRVARSELARFQRRKPPAPVTPKLLAWYERNRKREATG